MSLAVDLQSPSETWDAWQAPLAELRATGEEFDQFVRQQLDELDALRSSLDQREQWLEDERRNLDEEQADLEHQWQRLEELRGAAEQSAQKVKHEAKRLAKVQTDLDAAQAAFTARQETWTAENSNVQKDLAEKLLQLESLHAAASTQYAAAANQWAAEMQTARDRIRELEQQTASLEATRLELERNRTQLVDELAAATATDSEGIKARLAEVEQEKAALKEELAQAHQHTSRLAGSALELADSHGQLAQARAELLDLQHRLNESEKHSGSEFQQQIRSLEQERTSLETELESVRNRIVQLAEESALEKRRMTEERAEWSGELRQLRRVLEKNVVMLSHHQHTDETSRSHPPAPPELDPPSGQPVAPGEDPVLDSVMAQFEMLQKDLVRRRTSGHKLNRHEPS
jgi:chromosome segregation ATPase